MSGAPIPDQAPRQADLLAALRAVLVEVELAGGRVFGGEIPMREAQHMPRAALLIQPSGGPSLAGASGADADTQRIDLFAFGEALPDCAMLLGLAVGTLKTIERAVVATPSGEVLIHSVTSAGGFSLARDPVTQWPRAFQSLSVLHALRPIPQSN